MVHVLYLVLGTALIIAGEAFESIAVALMGLGFFILAAAERIVEKLNEKLD
jgi:hypothetical protein